MIDDTTFRFFFGITMVIISGLGLFFFLRSIKKSKDDSPILSLSRLRFILGLIAIGAFGLFLIFYKF